MTDKISGFDKIEMFLRDQIWSSYGVFATIVAIVVSIWIYYKQRPKTIIGYNIVSSSSIIKHYKGSEELKITFRNKEASTAHVSVVDIANIGTTAIKKDQYDIPIKLLFSDKAEIVSHSISNVNPREMNVEVSYEENVCRISELLLNKGDKFRITVVTINGSEHLTVTTRIINGSLVKINNRIAIPTVWGAIASFSGITTGLLVGMLSNNILGSNEVYMAILLATSVGILVCSGVILIYLKRSRALSGRR